MNNMTIEFQVENQILSRTDSQRIVEDSINYLYAHFTFSEDWANTTKAIIVENKKVDLRYKVYLNEQDTCKIPNAIVDYDGFSIIVVGENESNYVTITTSLLFVSVLMSNFTPTGEADLKYVTSDTLDVQKDGDIVNIEIPNIYFKDINLTNDILNLLGRDDLLLKSINMPYGKIHNITIEIDNTNYIFTLKAYDKDNVLLFTRSADFNIEGMLIKSASYDSATQELVLVFQNGNVVRIPISDILTGIATEDWVRQYFVAKENGKGLSTNDYTNEDKSKLGGIEAGAEVNVQSDWNENDSSKDDYIKNKPHIPTKTSDLQNDSGFIDNTYHDSTKQDVIDSSHKLNSDLVDDDNATHKFVSQEEKTQITTNKNGITSLQSNKADLTNTTQEITADKVKLNEIRDLSNNVLFDKASKVKLDNAYGPTYVGEDTSANILAKSSNTGIWKATDNNHWYYWNGAQYVDGGVYQTTQIADGSVTKTKLGSDVIDTLTSDLISILYLRNQLIDDMFGEVLANSTHGIYLLYTDGTEQPLSNYSASDYISVESNKEYRFITQSIPFDLQVCFYDHTKTFISGKLIPNARDVTFTNDVNYAKYIRFSYETKYENATILTPNDDLTKEKLDDLLKNTNVDLSEGNNVNQTILDGTVYWGTNLTVQTNSFIKGITLLNMDSTSVLNNGTVYFCYLSGSSYNIFDERDFTISNSGNNSIIFDTPVISKYTTIYVIVKLAGLRYANGGSSIGMSEFFLDTSGSYFTKGQTIGHYALAVIVNTTISIIDKVNTLMSRNYITVKKSGGDYTSIATAVKYAQENDTIIIYPGVYENEIIEASTKKIHLIGIDRETCIIKNNTNTYLTPALEISRGSVSNLSFIQDKDLESAITTDFPYAVHIDYPYLTNEKLVFDNCYFYSKFTASVGVGTRANCELIFNNCYFETEHNVNSINKHIGALFIHPSLTPNSDNQNVIINNCSLVSKLGSALHFETLNVSNTNTYVTLFKNFLYSKENGTTNVITVDGTYDNVHITDKSFGNNVNV